MSLYRLYYRAYYNYLIDNGIENPNQFFILDEDLNIINWPDNIQKPTTEQLETYLAQGRWVYEKELRNKKIREQILKINNIDLTAEELKTLDQDINGLCIVDNRLSFLFDGRLNYLV